MAARGFKIENEYAEKEFVISTERKKKGKRDGITVLMQRSIPSRAPARAVLPSRIRISIPVEARIPAGRLVCFKQLTSEESMQNASAAFIELKKGGADMEKGKAFLNRISGENDFFSDSLPGQPIAEIAGDRRVLIENHMGVKAYGRERIVVKVRYGFLCVCGCGLEILRMTRQQLVIRGKIDSVSLQRRG